MSLKPRKAQEDSSAKVPAYIVTFSDMVTLLLTFFVMLLSLAEVQDTDLFNAGQESFVRSIRNLGLGALTGRKQRADLGYVQPRHFIAIPDEGFKGRSLHAKEEEIRRLFKKVSRTVDTMPSQITASKTDFSVTNIRFSQGQTTLDQAAKRFLTEFSLNLQQNSEPRAIKLYVLGLTDDEETEKKQWITSAKRAYAVADFLKKRLPSRLGWPVYSWGAGPGGQWVDKSSPIYQQSQILIAVLRANK